MSNTGTRFIVGIYNYCDYWCEHCAFTRRCRNFADKSELEREADGSPPVDDATNAAFWNRLAVKLGKIRGQTPKFTIRFWSNCTSWTRSPSSSLIRMPVP